MKNNEATEDLALQQRISLSNGQGLQY